MKKFKFLVKYGYKKRVWRKAFLISNIIIGIVIMALINLPAIIGRFTTPEKPLENINVLIVDEIIGDESLISNFNSLLNPDVNNPTFNLKQITIQEIDIDSFWKNEDYSILVHFKGDIDNPIVDMYNKLENLNNILETQIELLMIGYKIADYNKPIFTINYAPDYENPEEAMALNSIVSFLVVPLFILIVMATQFIGVDIIEEKSTKAIETIISSVPAKIHFFSKIASSILFILTQGALLILFAFLGNLIAKSNAPNLPGGEGSLLHYISEILPNWPWVLFFTILFIVVGTLLYLVLASLFASMATTQEDYQQFQTPVMLVLLAGFYIGLFAPMAGGTTFMKVMTFVPIFTPMVGPIAFATGVLSTLEAIIALVVLIVFLILTVYFVSPVYRVAILSYEQTKLFTRVGSYFKKGFAKNK